MKHSKKILKQIFGSSNEGLSFLKGLNEEKELSPILFVYSDQDEKQALSFVDWLSFLVDKKVLSGNDNSINKSEKINSNLIIKSVAEVTDSLIDEVVKNRKLRKKTIVASHQRPKVLDYIHDPAFIIAKVDGFDFLQATSEIESLKKAISKA